MGALAYMIQQARFWDFHSAFATLPQHSLQMTPTWPMQEQSKNFCHLQHWCPWFQTQQWQLRQLWEPFGHSHSATFFPLSCGLDIYLIMTTPAILSFTFWLIWLIVWNRLISSLIFVFNILSEGGTQYSPIIWYHSNRGPWQQPPFLCVRAAASSENAKLFRLTVHCSTAAVLRSCNQSSQPIWQIWSLFGHCAPVTMCLWLVDDFVRTCCNKQTNDVAFDKHWYLGACIRSQTASIFASQISQLSSAVEENMGKQMKLLLLRKNAKVFSRSG